MSRSRPPRRACLSLAAALLSGCTAAVGDTGPAAPAPTAGPAAPGPPPATATERPAVRPPIALDPISPATPVPLTTPVPPTTPTTPATLGGPAVPEPTARQRRDALLAFLDASVALLPGPFRVEDDETPLSCPREDGTEGEAYLLSRFSGTVPTDPAAARERVLAAWRQQGLVVVLRDSPPTPQHLVELPGAGRAVLTVGPRGSALTAETRCAARTAP